MELRKIQLTNICYVILIDDYDLELPFVPPRNVNAKSIDYLKFLPKNLYQLIEPVFYAISEINTLYYNPYTVAFFKRSNKDQIIKYIEQTEQLSVVILDENKTSDIILINEISSIKKDFVYFLNIDNSESNYGESINKFLIELIYNDKIFSHFNIQKDNKRDFISVVFELNELRNYSYFLPTKTNFLVYNNYLGNFGYPYDIDDDKIEEFKQQAINSANSFNRLNLYLPQLKAFDSLFLKLKLTQEFEQQKNQINPIFFCLPFQNPDIKDFFPDTSSPLVKKVISTLQVEQTANYVFVIEGEERDQLIHRTAIQFIKERLSFLDSTCFLLSSFNLTPYVRLPILGKTIYRELSFIGPNHFNKYLTLKAQLKLSTTLSKIGKKLSKSIFSEEFSYYLKNRNSQIISLTDLPFEWIEIENVPLSFTHDITRIPETSFNNHLVSFVINSTLEFQIDQNIILKTLVIFGTDDKEFVKWHELIYELAEEKNFKVELCLSNDEFVEAVAKHNPDFLIIDTHGKFNDQTKETYLQMGEDHLTYKIIIENKVSVPLVFLSACGTAPTYGTFNPIANAFLQSGARSVTSTYLPVEINNATMGYLGILSNLNTVATEGTFKNWLEYICYNVRSSFLHRIFSPMLLDEDTDNKKQIEDRYFKNIQDILKFEKRRSIFADTENFLNSLKPKQISDIKPKAYEFLYYSNIGRGDLVMFKRYIDNFEKLNFD